MLMAVAYANGLFFPLLKYFKINSYFANRFNTFFKQLLCVWGSVRHGSCRNKRIDSLPSGSLPHRGNRHLNTSRDHRFYFVSNMTLMQNSKGIKLHEQSKHEQTFHIFLPVFCEPFCPRLQPGSHYRNEHLNEFLFLSITVFLIHLFIP